MYWEDCKYTVYSSFLVILKPMACSFVFYYSNFAIFAKITTFAKHENRENFILRNSRKFRETREHFREFRVSRKSWKEFRQKP
jgi:hypothetical protein